MGYEGVYYSKDLKYAMIIAGIAILTGALTYTWTGCYWATKRRLPCFDSKPEETENVFPQ
jgi:hypothetical protein